MNKALAFIKTTVVGGFVFLIPAVIVFIALGKLFGALKDFAKAIAPIFGAESFAGGAALDVLAIGVVVCISFIAGLLARRGTAKQIRAKLDSTLMSVVPGYIFIKGLADNLRQTEELSGSLLPVVVDLGDCEQIAFETNRHPDGKVAIYLPGAPNPWSGNIIFLPSERVRRIPVSLTEVIHNIRTLGKSSVELSTKVGTPD
jgi:uncharacterized membrane protein